MLRGVALLGILVINVRWFSMPAAEIIEPRLQGLAVQLWRNLLLILIGAGHAFGLWFGDILMVYGALGMVLVVLQRLPLAASLAAVGRMSLSGYLLQSAVCVLVYEGWAGGAWGTHGYLEQLALVAGMWIALLGLCPLWLAHYRFGPAEWCWRSLTWLRAQPMRVRSEP